MFTERVMGLHSGDFRISRIGKREEGWMDGHACFHGLEMHLHWL